VWPQSPSGNFVKGEDFFILPAVEPCIVKHIDKPATPTSLSPLLDGIFLREIQRGFSIELSGIYSNHCTSL
jgi:hypothetical protein